MSAKAKTSDDPRGLKRICTSCGVRFYDLNKRPIVCPDCDTEFTGEVKVKGRRGKLAAEPDKESQVKKKKAKDAETEEDDEEEIEDDDVVSLDDVKDAEDEADTDDDDDIDLGDDGLDDELDDDLGDDDLDVVLDDEDDDKSDIELDVKIPTGNKDE